MITKFVDDRITLTALRRKGVIEIGYAIRNSIDEFDSQLGEAIAMGRGTKLAQAKPNTVYCRHDLRLLPLEEVRSFGKKAQETYPGARLPRWVRSL